MKRLKILAKLDDAETRTAIIAERALLLLCMAAVRCHWVPGRGSNAAN